MRNHQEPMRALQHYDNTGVLVFPFIYYIEELANGKIRRKQKVFLFFPTAVCSLDGLEKF